MFNNLTRQDIRFVYQGVGRNRSLSAQTVMNRAEYLASMSTDYRFRQAMSEMAYIVYSDQQNGGAIANLDGRGSRKYSRQDWSRLLGADSSGDRNRLEVGDWVALANRQQSYYPGYSWNTRL